MSLKSICTIVEFSTSPSSIAICPYSIVVKRTIAASFEIKQRIQNLLFPEGIYYNRETNVELLG
jgi:hypothetical protein